MRKHIPNTLTATNLFMGLLAIVCVVQGAVWPAVACLTVGLIMDVADGFVARRLGVASPVGKELDSLADMVSFGAVPALIAMRMILAGLEPTALLTPAFLHGTNLLSLVGLLIGVFSGVRLAKFNLDTRQEDAFIGLPTPANTLLVVSLWVLASSETGSPSPAFFQEPLFWIVLSLLSSYLLIAPIRLLSLKFKHFGWRENRYRYILIILALVLGVALRFLAVPIVLLCYVALSIWAFGPGARS